jgi:superfamily II DNA/RNA helicase
MNKKSFTGARKRLIDARPSRNNNASSSRQRGQSSNSFGAKKSRSGTKKYSGSNKYGGGRSQGRSGRPLSGSFSRGSGRRSFGDSRGRGSGGNKRKQPSFNISSFINKSTSAAEEAPFVPKNSFEDFEVDSLIRRNLKLKGYKSPTAIQDEIIPHVLAGRDVIGLANTGTGKTAAFLIPLIDEIYSKRGGQVIVLTPTRELALQIDEEFRAFAQGMKLYSVVCVGGTPITPQIRSLKKYNHIVIGTPGRVIDLIKRGSLDLKGINRVVLDEADRMLDMGFINDMRFVLERITKDRQTLCFSATMSPTISKIVSDFLVDPVKVSVKTRDTAENIEQDVVRIAGRDKVDILIEHLTQDDFKKVLVFGRTKHGVEKLSHTLNKRNLKTESIHGNKSHGQRQRALKRFKDGEVRALIATDVAARGLDIHNVTHVINFDLPETYDDYVHRIGRTGRCDKKGKALTFVG